MGPKTYHGHVFQETTLQYILKLIRRTRRVCVRPDTLVDRLKDLRDAKDPILTIHEYEQVRSEFLGELATRPYMPVTQFFIFFAGTAASAAGVFYCLLQGFSGNSWVPGAPLIVLSLLWWRLERDYAMKRNLPHGERLRKLEELVVAALISAEEACVLRASIEKLYDSECSEGREHKKMRDTNFTNFRE